MSSINDPAPPFVEIMAGLKAAHNIITAQLEEQIDNSDLDAAAVSDALSILTQQMIELGKFKVNTVAGEVADERQRQIDKGYDAECDDEQGHEILAQAASALLALSVGGVETDWPWTDTKPSTHTTTRDDYIRAAAMLVSAVEVMDRSGKVF